MTDAIATPYSAQEIAALARAHGVAVAEGVAGFIRAFAKDPDEVYTVLEPMLRAGEYRPAAGGQLREAMVEYATRTDEEERLRLARLEIESSVSDQPRLDFLEDIRCHELDDGKAADLLLESYEASASNNDRRRDLLDIWDKCQVKSKTARVRLIDSVLLNMVEHGGKQALDYVLARPQLWENPEDRKTAVKTAFRNAAGGKGLDEKVERLLREYGVVKERKRGRFGVLGKEEIDED